MKNIINHFFGKFQNNEHEEREIFETMNAAPENITERIVEALKTQGQHEKAANLLEEHSDNPGILDQVKNQLETLRGSETEKQVITENFRNMQRQAAENQRERLKNAVETLQLNAETNEKLSDERIDTEKDTNEKALAKNDASLEESPVIPTDVAANVAEEDKRWLPRTPDPRKWTEKQIATVATITVGAVGLYAVYRWFKNRNANEQKQETSSSRFPKWLLWLPLIGIGAWGAYKLYKNYDKIRSVGDLADLAKEGVNDIADAAVKTYEGVAAVTEGVGEGLSTSVENFGKSMGEKGSFMKEVYQNKENYGSDAEFMAKLLAAGLADGFNYGLVGGGFYLFREGKSILCTVPEIAGAAWNFCTDSEASFESQGTEIIKLYTSAGVTYATSFGVIDYLWNVGALGNKKALMKAGAKSVFWPLEIYRKSGLKWAIGYLSPGAHGRLVRTEIMATATKPKFMWNRAKGYMKSGANEKAISGLWKEWKGWNKMLGYIHGQKEKDIHYVLGGRKNMVKHEMISAIRKYYKAEGKIPSFIEDASLIKQIKADQIDPEYLDAVLKKSVLNAVEDVATEVPQITRTQEVIESIIPEKMVVENIDEAVAGKITPEEVSKTPPKLKKAAGAEGMTEVVPEKKPELKLFKGEEASDEMIESVSRIASEDELVKEIAAAKNAKNEAKLAELLKHPMLEQAAKSSDEEVRALAKAANWAKRFAQSKGMRITGKVVGKGLIALGPAIDTYLIYDNQNQLKEAIEKNDTAAIERLKARQKSLEAAGAGGLLSLGLSFGPGILVGGAIMAGTMYTEAVYESIAEWEKTQEDYKHEDSALLLSKINQKVGEYSWGHSAGMGDIGIVRLWKKLTYSKDAYEKDVVGKHEEMAENNEGQRREMYAAYFLKNSFMPPLAGENPETYKSRVKEHVRHRMTFIEAMTEKTMGAVSSDTLGYSESYAELREIKARLEAEGNPALLSYEWNGEQKELDLTNLEAMSMPELISLVPRYHNEVKPLQLLEKWTMLDGIMKDSGQNASEVIRADVFNRLRDTINKAEMKIRTTNMNGLMDESEQNTVRLVLKDRLESEVTRIAASVMNESLDMEGLNQALQNIVATIDSIANNAQKTYDEAPDALKNKAYDEADGAALLMLAPNMGA